MSPLNKWNSKRPFGTLNPVLVSKEGYFTLPAFDNRQKFELL